MGAQQAQARNVVVATRPMEDRDLNFVKDSWTNSWGTPHRDSVLPSSVVRSSHRDHFDRVIAEQASVLVAVDPTCDDPDGEILGYLVHEEFDSPIVHWAYTKYPLRYKNVMAILLFDAGISLRSKIIVSCWNSRTSRIEAHFKKMGKPLTLERGPKFLRSNAWKERYRETEKDRLHQVRRVPAHQGTAGAGGEGPNVIYRRSTRSGHADSR